MNITKLQAEDKNQQVYLNIYEEDPKYFIGDINRLVQVLVILVSNAIKFTLEGGIIKISVNKASESKKNITLNFTVEDNGIGIASDEQARLFQSFTQADGTTTRQYGGTGLGLALAQKIVGLMKGDIWVESEKGKGSTFQFIVKLKKQLKDAQVEKTKHNDTKQITLEESLLRLKGCKILLVEDNDINQELVIELLTMNGIKVKTAFNGQEALDILKLETFDGVLMDCQMPVMDGYQATRKLRAYENLKNLPVIALTANVMKEDIEKAQKSGMNDIIAKPINPDQMFLTMANWIKVIQKKDTE